MPRTNYLSAFLFVTSLLGFAPMAAVSHAYSYEFEELRTKDSLPLVPQDINNSNVVVGSGIDPAAGVNRRMGFILDDGVITYIDYPGAGNLNGTRAAGINDDGLAVGSYTIETPGVADGRGFTYQDGVLNSLLVPGSSDTSALGLNNVGVISGRTFLAGSQTGIAFTLEESVYSTYVPDDLVGNFGISFEDINDSGNVVGRLLNSTGFGAFAIINDHYQPFRVQNSSLTTATGINNLDQIVGFFSDQSGYHGFLIDHTGVYQIDMPGVTGFSNGLLPTGINDNGFLVANVFMPSPPDAGFLLIPCEQPSENCTEAIRLGDSPIDFGDSDEDGITDRADNCTNVANSSQIDTNADGFGNACDPDLDNNLVVNFQDISLFAQAFSSTGNQDADFNGDDVVNFLDLIVLRDYFLSPPGPSGLVP